MQVKAEAHRIALPAEDPAIRLAPLDPDLVAPDLQAFLNAERARILAKGEAEREEGHDHENSDHPEDAGADQPEQRQRQPRPGGDEGKLVAPPCQRLVRPERRLIDRPIMTLAPEGA